MEREDVAAAVVEAIERFTGRAAETIKSSDSLIDDLGVDSLIAVRLLNAVEDHLGTRLPEGSEGNLVGLVTLGELVDRLTYILTVEADGPA